MIKPESGFGFWENGTFDVDFGGADAKKSLFALKTKFRHCRNAVPNLIFAIE